MTQVNFHLSSNMFVKCCLSKLGTEVKSTGQKKKKKKFCLQKERGKKSCSHHSSTMHLTNGWAINRRCKND